MSARPITIEKRKWDGSLSARWTARFTRDGPRAIWWTPRGTRREHPRRGDDQSEITPYDEVSATTGAGWLVTAVLGPGRRTIRYEVDATAGDERESGDVFAFVDLDLDLELAVGTTVVTDLIQFAERRSEMGYPPGLLTAATAALDAALKLHREGEWPFDGSLGEAVDG